MNILKGLGAIILGMIVIILSIVVVPVLVLEGAMLSVLLGDAFLYIIAILFIVFVLWLFIKH